MDFIKGEILAIDKPYGMTSFGALAHIRFLLSQKLGQKVKVGHAGTLDPLATGVFAVARHCPSMNAASSTMESAVATPPFILRDTYTGLSVG